MFDALKEKVAHYIYQDDFARPSVQLAAMVMLVDMALIDREISDEEQLMIASFLHDVMHLDLEKAHELFLHAKDIVEHAKKTADIDSFADYLRQHTERQTRIKALALLERLADADRELNSFEKDLIARYRDHLNV